MGSAAEREALKGFLLEALRNDLQQFKEFISDKVATGY